MRVQTTNAHEDQQGHELICAALADHESESDVQVMVSVENGVAILSGEVRTVAQRDELTDLAHSCIRARAVLNLARVGSQSALSDHEIIHKIASVFRRHPDLAADAILISVQGGVVNLSGAVKTPEDRRTCERIARMVPGVRSVQNHLAANAVLCVWYELDARKIRQALEQTLGRRRSEIHVACVGEIIALSGTVEEAWEKELAEITAARCAGRVVRNQILVYRSRNHSVAS